MKVYINEIPPGFQFWEMAAMLDARGWYRFHDDIKQVVIQSAGIGSGYLNQFRKNNGRVHYFEGDDEADIMALIKRLGDLTIEKVVD